MKPRKRRSKTVRRTPYLHTRQGLLAYPKSPAEVEHTINLHAAKPPYGATMHNKDEGL